MGGWRLGSHCLEVGLAIFGRPLAYCSWFLVWCSWSFFVLGLRASDQRGLYKYPLPTCQRVTVSLEAMLRRQGSLAWF